MSLPAENSTLSSQEMKISCCEKCCILKVKLPQLISTQENWTIPLQEK